MDPILHTTASLLLDLALKAIGAGGVVTIVYNMLGLARKLGAFEQKIEEGFKSHGEAYRAIVIRVDRNFERVDVLVHEVGELRGEIRRINGGK